MERVACNNVLGPGNYLSIYLKAVKPKETYVEVVGRRHLGTLTSRQQSGNKRYTNFVVFP
jgi:hypothetical protein